MLVTGAGGSIGSELCRQILQEGPARLLLLDHNEFGLYNIHQELEQARLAGSSATEIVPLLASVTNPTRLASIFHEHRPSTVYHAAAYKHVPLVEQNASEGILNNVYGTLATARAAVESGNRALHPDLHRQGGAPHQRDGRQQAHRRAGAASPGHGAGAVFLDGEAAPVANQTCFAMVRFGNVLGSSGSVVPLFRRQIAAGGPITVTHADVTRYFMTIPEAAQLVLHAAAMAKGAEVFILDMGQPVKILDLAHRMVALSGLTIRDQDRTDGDIEITVTGLRPGEKLYEELLIGNNPREDGAPPHHAGARGYPALARAGAGTARAAARGDRQ